MITTINEFRKFHINENLTSTNVPEITIDDNMVNYQLLVDDNLVEIEGTINNTHNNLEFEPTYFSDSFSELYFDNNWEDIEQQILDKL